MEPFSWDLLTERGVEVLFLATPHEQSREWAPEALERGMRVIDLSGAWRLTDAANRAVYAFEDEGTRAGRGHAGAGRLRHAGVASQADCRRAAGRQSRLLCDFGHSAAEAAGRGGTASIWSTALLPTPRAA